MASFSWIEQQKVPFAQRYSAGKWFGHDAWSQMGLAMIGELKLIRLRLNALRREVHLGLGTLKCPRIFISHRQADKEEALRIAKIATEAGFQYWLDVLDPPVEWLQGYAIQRTDQLNYTQLVAMAMETALLNCSHVITMITPNTPPNSTWEAYAFGRVQDRVLCSSQAACWLHPSCTSTSLTDYMLLGDVTITEDNLRAWMKYELDAWQARFRTSCPDGACETWKGRTRKLPK